MTKHKQCRPQGSKSMSMAAIFGQTALSISVSLLSVSVLSLIILPL